MQLLHVEATKKMPPGCAVAAAHAHDDIEWNEIGFTQIRPGIVVTNLLYTPFEDGLPHVRDDDGLV